MSNGLTGGFDAVVLVRLPVVDGLLATFHRNGGSETKSPSLLHSFTLPVGTPGLPAEDHQILAWAQSYDLAGDLMKVGQKTFQQAPPGVLQAIESATLELERIEDNPLQIQGWNGYGQVQASTPTVSFEPAATSEVTTTFKLRVRFLRSVGSANLAEPIHGEVRANFLIDLQSSTGGTIVLGVEPSGDDSEIYFTPDPGSGLSQIDADQISFQVRDALRNRFEPMTLELDAGFPFSGFKALGAGSDQTLALPVMLSGGAAPSLAGVNQQFLDFSDHFGIAISEDYVDPKLQPMLDSLEDVSFTQTIEFIGISVATYHVSVSSASLAWKTGEFEVTVHGSAVTGSIFPNYNFTVKQRLTLVLDTSTQAITLVAVGDPTITGLPDGAAEEALPTIKNHRDAAIASAQSQIAAALAEVSMDDALSSFDGAPPTVYNSLDILPEGIILHGQVEYRGASYAQLDIQETADGKGFSALHSWMPGGWIERFVWSWKEAGFLRLPWGGTVHTETHEHVFTLAKPSPNTNVAGICLLVQGSQLSSIGTGIPNVEGGEVCKVSVPSWMVATMPKWWDLLLPIWEVDPPPEEMLDEAVAAHVNMNAHATDRTKLGANTIVHFAGEGAQAPLDALDAALGRLRGGAFQQVGDPGGQERPDDGGREGRRQEPPVVLCLVLPRGSLSESRATVEKRLGSLERDLNVLLTVRGEFVWQHPGPPDSQAFAEINRHLLAGPPLRYHPLKLDLPRCGPAPNLLFPVGGGRRMALRRLRGRPVWLLFWKAWSKPCLRELRRLQGVHEVSDGEGPVILAVNSGEDPKALTALTDELGLTLTIVTDPAGGIARRYGVPCWPTTVFIDEDGNVSGAHFGATPRARPESAAE